MVRKAAADEQRLHQEWYARRAPLHTAIMRRTLFFPDRRLLQFDCGKLQVSGRACARTRVGRQAGLRASACAPGLACAAGMLARGGLLVRAFVCVCACACVCAGRMHACPRAREWNVERRCPGLCTGSGSLLL